MSAMDLLLMNKQFTDNPVYIYNYNGDRFDISNQPKIDNVNLNDLVNSLTRTGKAFERYMFNGVYVPRVTSILDYCKGNIEYLNKWAAKLGDKYPTESENNLYVGSKVHNAIEKFLSSHVEIDTKDIRRCKDDILTSYNNFRIWYDKVIFNTGRPIELYVSEMPIISPYFGGTLDAILKIGDKMFLVDFKTSKSISTEYFIQICAYKWIIDNYYPDLPKLDGLGVLRFDKKIKNCYQCVFLEIDKDIDYITMCQQTFGVALNMFYSMNILNKETRTIIKNNKEEIFNV